MCARPAGWVSDGVRGTSGRRMWAARGECEDEGQHGSARLGWARWRQGMGERRCERDVKARYEVRRHVCQGG